MIITNSIKMTPKEKMRELIEKFKKQDITLIFINENNESLLVTDNMTYHSAKQCALIAVDEILFQYTTLNSDLVNWIYKTDKVVYWQQVRKEIEAL